MNINFCFIPTVLLALLLFYLGNYFGSLKQKSTAIWILLFISVPLSIPAVLFVVYYLHWFDNAAWFYQLRSYPCVELSAAGIGLLAGLIAGAIKRRNLFSVSFLVSLLVIILFVPHSKSAMFPVDYSSLEDRWENGICLQTSGATCGPACAATLLRHYGIQTTEQELAKTCYSYIGGTEIWYIARALRKQGLVCKFVIYRTKSYTLPYPSIAGIDMGVGHFIAILDKQGDYYLVGDPLAGEQRIKEEDIFENIPFTGFFLVVSNR